MKTGAVRQFAFATFSLLLLTPAFYAFGDTSLTIKSYLSCVKSTYISALTEADVGKREARAKALVNCAPYRDQVANRVPAETLFELDSKIDAAIEKGLEHALDSGG